MFWVGATVAAIVAIVLVVFVTIPKWSTDDDEFYNEEE